MPKLPDGAPIVWPLRDRLAVFGLGGVVAAGMYVVTVLARRDHSGRLYTKTWYWIDATPYLTTVPAMIITAALAFAVLVPLYERWQLPLVGVALIAVAVGLGHSLRNTVLGVERGRAT